MDLSKTQKLLLETIAKSPSSPTQIAKITGLSLPYITTQLAILEASGVISKFILRNSGPGKPQSIFHISKPIFQLTCITDGCGQTTVFRDPFMKTYLHLISLIPSSFRNPFSEYFWASKEYESVVQARGLISVEKDVIELIALTEKEHLERLRKRISHFESKGEGGVKKIVCWVHTLHELIEGVKKNDSYYLDISKKVKPILDPNNLFGSVKDE